MEPIHILNIAADDGREVLLVCPESGCQRRLVLKRSGEMIVIDRGDFFARHVGGSDPLKMSTALSH